MKNIYIVLILSFLYPQDDYYEYKLIPDYIQNWGSGFGVYLSCNDSQFITNTKTSNGSQVSQVMQFYGLNDENWESQFNIELEYLDGVMNHQLDEDFYFLLINESNINGPPTNYGELHIYENYSSSWYPYQVVYNPDPDNYYNFGQAFYRNGDLLIVSANDWANNVVKLYIYRLAVNGWIEEFSIEMEDQEYFGTDNLYIDENMLIYGEYSADLTGEGSNEGRVLIYNRIVGNWEWEFDTLLTSDSMIVNGQFGFKIEYKDEALFVGAHNENNITGAVYVFTKIDGLWSQIQRLQASDSSQNSRFGFDLKVDENNLLISASKNDDAGPGSGSIYVFNKSQDNLWVETRKICSSDLEAIDGFGGEIGFVNDYIVASAPLKDNLQGAIYIYDLADTMLHSNFATYPVTGNAPLSLNFNDLSQGNPTSWQWDFDSDGVIDSEEQYPEFTYEFSGDYTVTLIVSNTEETSTFTKENYISVAGGLTYGDLNSDNSVNIIDIIIMVDIILGYTEPTQTQVEAADVNNSATIDIVDIVMVVNEILEEMN